MLKAVILDFDGTLVSQDMLSVVCGIAGKEAESERINKEYHAGKRSGLSPLITRINFLRGVTLSQISAKLDENPYVVNGAKELLDFLKQKNIVSIVSSGNILPILQYYQKLLGIGYIAGTMPKMHEEVIIGIGEEDFPGRDFKAEAVKKILGDLSIAKEATLAIGDSPADKQLFALSQTSIAINPKEGIEKYATFVIHDNLQEAIPIIKKLLD